MAEQKLNNINEEKTAAASYILTFYQNIAALNHNYAVYYNMMLEVQHKYPDPSKTSDFEKNAIAQQAQLARYCCQMVMIQYQSIIPNLNILPDPQLLQSYEDARKAYIVDVKVLENFVIQINKFLVNSVIKQLLESSQQFLDQVYS